MLRLFCLAELSDKNIRLRFMDGVNIEDIKIIAYLAGKEIIARYSKELSVTQKLDESPLTEADLAAEKIIQSGLGKYGYPVLSEESADNRKRLGAEYVWVVDPLDGTADFIQKTGEFAVMIGLLRRNRPILGVVFEPVSGRCYSAQQGLGAYCEQDGIAGKLSVSNQGDPTTFRMLVSRNHLLPNEIRLFDKLQMREKITMGSAGLKLCRIASGNAEIYVNSSDKTSEWDTCAGNIILTEAGGKITDLKGRELDYNSEDTKHRDGFVATNGQRHGDIVSAFNHLDQA